MSDETFEETLGRLRSRYVDKARLRCDGLEAALDALEASASNGEALDELQQSFHKLSGSGATYGFPRVTELGLQGELACDVIRKRATLVSGDEIEALRSFVRELRLEFDESS